MVQAFHRVPPLPLPGIPRFHVHAPEPSLEEQRAGWFFGLRGRSEVVILAILEPIQVEPEMAQVVIEPQLDLGIPQLGLDCFNQAVGPEGVWRYVHRKKMSAPMTTIAARLRRTTHQGAKSGSPYSSLAIFSFNCACSLSVMCLVYLLFQEAQFISHHTPRSIQILFCPREPCAYAFSSLPQSVFVFVLQASDLAFVLYAPPRSSVESLQSGACLYLVVYVL